MKAERAWFLPYLQGESKFYLYRIVKGCCLIDGGRRRLFAFLFDLSDMEHSLPGGEVRYSGDEDEDA